MAGEMALGKPPNSLAARQNPADQRTQRLDALQNEVAALGHEYFPKWVMVHGMLRKLEVGGRPLGHGFLSVTNREAVRGSHANIGMQVGARGETRAQMGH